MSKLFQAAHAARWWLCCAGLLLLSLSASRLQTVYAVIDPNKEGTIVAPAGAGSPGVQWQGTTPPGSGGTSASTCVDGGNAWFYKLHLQVPANYYATHDSSLKARIDWTAASGNPTTSDMALFVTDSLGNELTSSDGGETKEAIQLDNLPGGDYNIIACAFLVAVPQPFLGQASFISTLKSVTPPLPAPEDGDRGLKFSATTIVDPQRDMGEPSLRIDLKNNIYSCGPSGRNEFAQKSEDGGDTFRILGSPPDGRVETAGGGDCEISVGTITNTNGEYTLSLTGLEQLANFSSSRSQDAGRSFIGGSTTESPAGVDRQWMETSGAEEVYLAYNSTAFGYTVQRSTDGGLTFGVPVTAATGVFHGGPLRIDQDTSHNPLYNGLTPTLNNEIVYASYTTVDSVNIVRSYDEGLTWSRFPVITNVNPNNLFAGLAMDTAGNLYVTWTEKGSFNTYYAFSKRPSVGPGGAGDTWSSKRLVNRAPIESTVMPWIEAGDPGRIVVTYYGSPSDGNIENGAFRGYWDIYASTSFHALDAPDGNGNVPFALTKATTHPVHWDSICVSGLGCNLSVPSGDRSLADFFQNRLDQRGAIHIVFSQSNKIPGDTSGRRTLDTYVKQIGGPGLYTAQTPTVDTRPVVRTGGTDPLNDAKFPFSNFGVPITQTNLNALDITGLQLVPQCASTHPGSFEVRLSMRDVSDAALSQALADQGAKGSPAGSLLWVLRFFSGTDPYAAVAKWSPSQGFTFGLDNTIQSSSAGLEIYPGTSRAIPGARSGSSLITMTVTISDVMALDLPATPSGSPTIRPAHAFDRIYDVTAFSFGNSSANPSTQTFLNQGDSTAPFDYILSPYGCGPYYFPIIER